MPKVVITHPVTDVDHWLSKHHERVEIFAGWGTNVVDYAIADGSNMVALTIDVHNMEAMQADMATEEMNKAKDAHGVMEPIVMYMASD